MKFKHYEIIGQDAYAAYKEHNDHNVAVSKRIREFAAEVGGNGFRRRGDTFVGISFEGKAPRGWKRDQRHANIFRPTDKVSAAIREKFATLGDWRTTESLAHRFGVTGSFITDNAIYSPGFRTWRGTSLILMYVPDIPMETGEGEVTFVPAGDQFRALSESEVTLLEASFQFQAESENGPDPFSKVTQTIGAVLDMRHITVLAGGTDGLFRVCATLQRTINATPHQDDWRQLIVTTLAVLSRTTRGAPVYLLETEPADHPIIDAIALPSSAFQIQW